MKKAVSFLIIVLAAWTASAASPFSTDKNDDGRPDQWYEIVAGKIVKMSLDRNFDTVIDYVVRYDQAGLKLYEAGDYNYDGEMDDFYFFEAGKLIRQEIDSNFDSDIDIWVYMKDGIYIHRYEMDTDFDGIVDTEKDFSQ
ncbi:MAG TPA: hypothetical protein ENI27_07790 [bacterium]|nr:hypothetical protein [bacterium]